MMKANRFYRAIGLALIVIILPACAPVIPPDALKLNAVSLERKQLQTRRFDGISARDLLSACSGVLQDLGFNLDESETELGVLVASKQRSAVEAGQVFAAVIIAVAGGGSTPIDKDQKIRVSLVVRPSSASYEGDESHLVRITFQRIIRNTQGQISRQEGVFDADIYQEFFDNLSKAVFLEAHQI